MKYDIIIPVAFRDYPFLNKTIEYIEKFLEFDHIYIVTHYDMRSCLPQSIRKNSHCLILDENDIVPELTFTKLYSSLIKHGTKEPRVGWLLQQFVKMGFSKSPYCKNEYYLSWDADTIPLCHIDFFENDHPYFSMKEEHMPSYFNAIHKLLNINAYNPQSYIAEHMIFNKSIMNELINDIERKSSIPGDNWIEKIVNSTDTNTLCSFSEFETYGNYCFQNYPQLYIERKLPSFRCGNYIQGRYINNRILKELGMYHLAIVSFEIYMKPPFPWNIANWWYNIYIKHFLYKKFRVIQKIHHRFL